MLANIHHFLWPFIGLHLAFCQVTMYSNSVFAKIIFIYQYIKGCKKISVINVAFYIYSPLENNANFLYFTILLNMLAKAGIYTWITLSIEEKKFRILFCQYCKSSRSIVHITLLNY